MLSALDRLRYRVGKTGVRVPVVWYRHRSFTPSDVFLGCYPRSGSTWLRFMLFEILSGERAQFENVNSAFRGAGDHFQALPLLPGKGRLVGSHEAYRKEYGKAVYLVRDVRDVVLSYFALESELGVSTPDFDEYLLEFLRGRGKRYGSWQVHVNSWLDSKAARSGNLFLVRYHELRNDPEEVLFGLCRFLGADIDRERIHIAVMNNSLEKMRAKEDELHAKPAMVYFPHKPQRGSHEEGRFVRSGKVGGWRARLTEPQERLIEQYAGSTLLRIGCSLGAAAVASSEVEQQV